MRHVVKWLIVPAILTASLAAISAEPAEAARVRVHVGYGGYGGYVGPSYWGPRWAGYGPRYGYGYGYRVRRPYAYAVPGPVRVHVYRPAVVYPRYEVAPVYVAPSPCESRRYGVWEY